MLADCHVDPSGLHAESKPSTIPSRFTSSQGLLSLTPLLIAAYGSESMQYSKLMLSILSLRLALAAHGCSGCCGSALAWVSQRAAP